MSFLLGTVALWTGRIVIAFWLAILAGITGRIVVEAWIVTRHVTPRRHRDAARNAVRLQHPSLGAYADDLADIPVDTITRLYDTPEDQ